MAYQHIENLYKAQQILGFKEVYAMEKLNGTSAHITYKATTSENKLGFFAGGGKYETFVELFDAETIQAKLEEIFKGTNKFVIIYGEFYGGKLQGMSDTYGPNQKFAAFEVKIGDSWLNVDAAEQFVKSLGIEFVHYVRIPCTLAAIDEQRDAPSVQAIRNGFGEHTDKYGFCPPMREGIVLRPIEEVTFNNGDRVVAKHKRDEFKETNTTRKVSEEKLVVLAKAREIAAEWVTFERLSHVLSKGTIEIKIENTGKIIDVMIEDILREGDREIIDTPAARKEIGRLSAMLFKQHLQSLLTEVSGEE